MDQQRRDDSTTEGSGSGDDRSDGGATRVVPTAASATGPDGSGTTAEPTLAERINAPREAPDDAIPRREAGRTDETGRTDDASPTTANPTAAAATDAATTTAATTGAATTSAAPTTTTPTAAPTAPDRAPWDRPSTAPSPSPSPWGDGGHGHGPGAPWQQQPQGYYPSYPGGHAPTGPGGPQGPWTGPQYAAPWGPPPGQGHGPQGHGPQGPPPWGRPTTATDRRPPRRTLIIGAIVVAVVGALLVTAVVLVDGATTRRTANGAAEDVATWSGVTYRGQIADGLGGPASVEMTVDAQGNAAGTITRASGGRAEFLRTPTAQALRADEAWWRTSAPRPTLATKLAGVWVSAADDQLAGVSGWAVAPGELSRAIGGRPWSDVESRSVGGVEASVLGDQADRVSVDDTGDVPRLAEVELAGFGRQRTSPVSTERAAPPALQTVASTATLLPSMPAVRAVIAAPSRISARAEPGPTCTTPTCPVTYRLVNLGRYRTAGTLTLTLNGAPFTSFPFDAAPGAVLPFSATYPNQAYAGGTASATAFLGARTVVSE